MFPDFLDQSSEEVARKLLGCILVREIEDTQIVVRIIETEAYDQADAASHSFNGQTPRTAVMFGPSGYLYVYFTYGMHYCCNVVTGESGEGSAVLIRGVEPVIGREAIEAWRNKTGVEATNGPAKLCQALQIGKELNGHNLQSSPLKLFTDVSILEKDIVQTTRIGITKARDELRRFYVRNNHYVSKK